MIEYENMPETTCPFESENHTILLVGGTKQLKESISHILEEYTVFETEEDKDPLTETAALLPGVIICDIEGDGDKQFRFLRAIKSDPSLNDIPVIILTSCNSVDMKIKGLEAGADDFIVKPVSERVLMLRINNLIKLRNQEIILKRLNEELERKVEEQLHIIVKNERLTKFFPGKLLRWILSSDKDVELSSEKKKLTIFFSDLAGFTELAENTSPEEVRNLLNEYFTEMVKFVDLYDGTLDKFIGDGLMVFFGAPYPMDEAKQAIQAVSMAVAMQIKMKALTGKWKKQGIKQTIKIRMGIHQDYVMVGNFGSRQMLEYTVFGSGVNLASRLESYCEPQKILVSLPVYHHVKSLFPFSPVKEQIFRGFERLVPVSELDPDAAAAAQPDMFAIRK